jgi:hypothetical protein
MTKTINGKKYENLVGSRAQVWHGTAYKTSGGLKKQNLMMNKAGRIVSKDKHHTAKKEKRLLKAGYGTKKGQFGFVRLGSYKKGKSKGTRSRKMRGGGTFPLNPAPFNGKGVGTSGVNLQFVAGNASS